jgi:hypothetical protein
MSKKEYISEANTYWLLASQEGCSAVADIAAIAIPDMMLTQLRSP